MDDTKFPLTSMDLTEEQLKKMKELFPEVFTEGNKIDWERLKLTLGENVDVGKERYGMNWPGKADCFKTIQQKSVATLVPVREESVDFDTTENLFIEGDNLEVLKLLQKSYLGKVKMIYIDPPYNTGNDFIYPDNYSENLDTYLQYTGQVDAEGKKFATNPDTDGRYHSKWMNMMYPRLFLAKNLLKEDGVIFISIDDHEVDNLKVIMNEIFGEENFVAAFVWRKTDNQANIGNIARVKEYIICYAKSQNLKLYKMKLTERAKKEYRYKDNLGEFRRSILLHKTRGRHFYDVETYSGKILNGPWMIKQDEFSVLKANNGIYWTKSGDEQPYGKIYLSQSEGQISNDFLGIEFGTNQEGSLEVEELLEKRVFDFPKPHSLIKHFVTIGSKSNDIVLDFFAGSGTTAHAVMAINAEDKGNRKCISVQLPETISENSEVYKLGYRNIADIAKERILKAGKKVARDCENKGLDIGFKVLKLETSNFSIWDSSIDKQPNDIQQKLLHHIDHVSQKVEQEAILYELLLKSGFELTTQIRKVELEKKIIFSIAEGELLICLERELTHELMNKMADMKPSRVICLDEGFQNNDQLKTNAVQLMKSKGVGKFQTV